MKKDLKKSAEYFDLSCKAGNMESIIFSVDIYLYGRFGFPLDYEKALKYCKMGLEKEKYMETKITEILSIAQFEWEMELHRFWPKTPQLDKKIITLLLISKNKSSSKGGQFMIKGITMIIIQFLCHLDQLMLYK